MTGTTLFSKTSQVNLASYSTGNPFYIGTGTSIVTTAGDAIYGSNAEAWTLTNAGTVSGANDGIDLRLGGQVTNKAGGEILGATRAVSIIGAMGDVTNTGTIAASAGIGIYLDSGGTVVNGSTAATMASVTGSKDGIYGTNAAVNVTNFGTIAGTGNSATGVDLTFGGTVNNDGTASHITGTGYGISGTSATTVHNAGTITGHGSGISLQYGGVIANLGGASYIGGRVGIEGASTVTNAGTIVGTREQGIYLRHGGTVTNHAGATIKGQLSGVELYYLGTVVNAGTITGLRGGGVRINGGGIVINQGPGAEIDGGVAMVSTQPFSVAAEVSNGPGAIIEDSVAFDFVVGILDNAGTVLGEVSFEGNSTYNNTLINSGSIVAPNNPDAVQFAEGNDLLVIDPGALFVGAVDGGGGTNTLELAMGASAGTLTGLGTQFTNFEEIVVDAGASWMFAGASIIDLGETLTENGNSTFSGTVTNAGTIRATSSTAIGVDFTGTGNNTLWAIGKIVGGTSGRAVQFAAGHDLLVIDPGAVFVGGVDGGGGTNTLELAKGATEGTVSGIGSEFTNFQTVIVEAGASWRLTGANSLSAGTMLTSDGILTVTGTISGAGTLTLGGGTAVINAGAKFTMASWSLAYAGAVTLNENLTYAGAFSQGSGQTFSISTAHALTLTGISTLAGTVRGEGDLVLGRGTTAINSGARLSVASWALNGSGTVTVNERLTYTGSFSQGLNPTVVISTGDILNLAGTSTLAGAVSGAGNLVLGGGTTTINTGAKFTVASLSLAGSKTAVTLDEDLIYAGAFSDAAGTSLMIAAGKVLTLSGAVTGAGTLEIGSGSTLHVANSVAPTQEIDFTTGAGEVLKFANSTNFKAGIGDFVSGDRLDVTGVAYHADDTVSFVENSGNTGGTLTIKNGTTTLLSLTLFGQYTASEFALATNGATGMFITTTLPAAPTPLQLAAHH